MLGKQEILGKEKDTWKARDAKERKGKERKGREKQGVGTARDGNSKAEHKRGMRKSKG